MSKRYGVVFGVSGWGNRVWKGWERRLVNEFRDIVREPLPDPDDPRFKKWNPGERFPWAWDLAQQQSAATRTMTTPEQFAAAWRYYRRRRRWFIGTGVGGVLVATLVVTLSNRPPLGLVSFWALGPAWMICFLIVAVRFQLFKCPRCCLPFSNGNPWSRTCLHCGLPKWSVQDPRKAPDV